MKRFTIFTLAAILCVVSLTVSVHKTAYGGPTEVLEITQRIHTIDYYGDECYVTTQRWDLVVANNHWGNYHAAEGTTAHARKYPHNNDHGGTPIGGYIYDIDNHMGPWTCDGAYVITDPIIVTPEDDGGVEEFEDEEQEPIEEPDFIGDPNELADAGGDGQG